MGQNATNFRSIGRVFAHEKNKNSFTHKRTFLSALVVINNKFNANLVGRIWASNLNQNSIDTVANVW